MPQNRTIRTAATALFAMAAVLCLSGCGDVNAASAAGRDFEQLLDGVPEVADVDTTGSNTLPWSGTASASVLMDDDVSDARLSAIVDRIGGFLNKQAKRSAGATWEGVDLTVRGFTLSVLDRRADNATQLELLASLEDEGVPGGELQLASAGTDGARASSLTLVARPGEDFLAAYDLARSTADATPAYAAAIVTGRSDDGVDPAEPGEDDADDAAPGLPDWDATARFSISSGADDDATASGDPGPTRAAYLAVAEQFEVIGATLTPDTIDLRIASVDDVAAATAVATGAVPADVAVEVQGGIVTWDDGVQSAEMLPVVQALSAVPGVTAIAASSDRLGIAVSDPAAGRAALDALDALPAASVVESLRIGGPVANGTFSVTGSRLDVASLFTLVEQLTASGSLASFEGSAGRLQVDVRAADDATLGAAIGLVKAGIAPGTWTRIGVDGERGTWWFDAIDTITIDASEYADESPEETALRERIERLWNAA
ncbi:hypothetical protein SAMN06295909_0938 [Plantibacter sp. VKM Ac-1784]|uniref:Uncharacterized protein n=1 Tax=Plantibacter elymi (nom. nud.) TaxID=199708 RepID=A0ABY1RBY2_9MICO|nr:hypothetical protein [Plantibacter sp. VKM Ac-1784]SMQ63841.1 hypothetical protein SAMN06295909_0938 [Plantibacter sp. VKM Ac-1784]